MRPACGATSPLDPRWVSLCRARATMRFTFDEIEQLKQRYTDKMVAVDTALPELRRFEHQTGRVKTVNMSGRALVEFDAYDNIGWYDIELDFLRVIDQPLAK